MQQLLDVARFRWFLQMAAAAALISAGCTVDITDQSGPNPCDPNPCEKVGVCSDWTATCTVTNNKAVCSKWKPKAGATPKDDAGAPLTAPQSFEQNETLCDGLDNDCDGMVDESVVGDPVATCGGSAAGVCAGSTPAMICVAGKWRCEWVAVPAYEATETTCDGKDNDCDGETDEGVKPKATTCKRAGVCAGLAAPTCANGSWDCHYDAAPDYEEATETKCDGKDNNCDGLVDSGLGSLADGTTCDNVGVCKDKVTIACVGGKPTCTYDKVADWQNVESTCDGKDNDCDGTVDNLAGTAQPLADGDVSSCASEGVCKAAKSKITRLCVQGAFACEYGAVPGWEAKETLCDGLDNDCDGAVDGNLSLPAGAAAPCGTDGVCAQGKALCGGGIWSCDWATLLKEEAYEKFEFTCDGKDNDCDGQTDEDPSAPGANGCAAKGVCQWGVAVACSSGEATCDYSHVMAYEGVTETSCDGLDNDCDGDVDEVEGLDISASGCGLGVCKDKAKATCGGGKWQCSYDGVAGYEGAELTCDGLDNDCDGATDEGLTDAVAAKCKTKGVCSTGVTAMCVAGKYNCYYPVGYEASESSCDGLDNDCDGQIDTKVCAAGKTCQQDDSCSTGVCAALPAGGAKVCTSKAGQCAMLSGDGQVAFTDGGASACLDEANLAKCTNSAWDTPSKCTGETPACFGGKCLKCVPNKLSCENTFVASKVVQCGADGTTAVDVKTCDGATRCVGSGVCVTDTPFSVGDGKGDEVMPATAVMGEGFVVAWTGDNVGARIFDGKGDAAGAVVAVSENFKPAAGQRVAVAANATGFAVAWVTVAGNDGEMIALRLFDKTGKALNAEVLINTIKAGNQNEPALAATAGGWIAAWTSEALDQDGTGRGIAVRLLDASGKAAAAEFAANKAVNVNDNSETGNQTQPSVAAASDGRFAVAWRHDADGASQTITGRVFDAAGAAKTGNVTLSNSQKIKRREPAITWAGATIAGAWIYTDTNPQTQKAEEIYFRRFDTSLSPLGDAMAANVAGTGNQLTPAIANDGKGRVTVVWATTGDGSGLDISSRDVSSGGGFSPAASDAPLSEPAANGEQDQPAVVTYDDGRVLIVWRDRAKDGDNGAIKASFR